MCFFCFFKYGAFHFSCQVEDELPELSLSSASASSSDEPVKVKRNGESKSLKSLKDTSRVHRSATTAARQEYPVVVVREEINDQAGNRPNFKTSSLSPKVRLVLYLLTRLNEIVNQA